MLRKLLRVALGAIVAMAILAGATVRITRDPVQGTNVWFQTYTEGCTSAMLNPC